jgi:hypothetical protein
MGIVRDDCDERQLRVDRMVDELRKAQSRPSKATTVKGDDHVVQFHGDSSGRVPVAGSTTASTSHSNG